MRITLQENRRQMRRRSCVVHLFLLVTLLAVLLVPLLPAQIALAQDSPPVPAPVEPLVEQPAAPVQPAAITAGPPNRATTFTGVGSIFYPAQARFSSDASATIETWVSSSILHKDSDNGLKNRYFSQFVTIRRIKIYLWG